MKIDIEGVDIQVLQDTSQLLAIVKKMFTISLEEDGTVLGEEAEAFKVVLDRCDDSVNALDRIILAMVEAEEEEDDYQEV